MTTKQSFRRTIRAAVVTAALGTGVLVPAGAAVAQEYPTPSTTPSVPSTSAVEVSSEGAGGTLPVTGGELAGLTLAGLGVAGAGVALVVAARRRPSRVEVEARA